MSQDDKPAEYSLVCPLLNADPVFAHGVEFGMIWCQMRDPDCKSIVDYIRTENEEQVRLAATRTGWEVIGLEPWTFEGQETGWILLKMKRRRK